MKAEGRRADGVSCDFIWVHRTEGRQGEEGLGRWAAARRGSPARGPWPSGPATAHPLSGSLHGAPPLRAPQGAA